MIKKLFTFIAVALTAMTAGATDYTDSLDIYLNGEGPYTSTASVSVDEQQGSDGLYTIMLKQFSFNSLIIGDVTMKDVKGDDDTDGNTWFETEQDAEITNGGYIAGQLGGKVHVTIHKGSRLSNNKLYLVISLPVDIPALSMVFDVTAIFGNGGYQLANPGFESFHTAKYNDKTSDEPDGWHSFMSSTGSLAGFVSTNTHTYKSDDAHSGKSSVKVVSGIVLGFQPANGTITTGRLKAGGFVPASTDNCSFLDMSLTDVDGNGDPFYATFSGTPDSLAVWVKYKQGVLDDKNKDYKYATVSAIITDGTYYQDPEPAGAGYKNVVAKANSATIESQDFTWQRVVVPFDYDTYASNNAKAKAMLVTLSTNAQPGVASKDSIQLDELYVDDIAMIYNAGLTSVNVKGTEVALEAGKTEYDVEGVSGVVTADDIAAVSDGRGAFVAKTVEAAEDGAKATVAVTSNDYQKTNVYTFNIKGASSDITKTTATQSNAGVAMYNINGQRVSSDAQRGLYIIRKADGTSVKVLRK